MKKVGKSILLTLCLILTFSSLAACASTGGNDSADPAPGGNQGSSGGKVQIKFSGWGEPEEKELYEQIIKNFEAQNPNIKVQYIHIPADYGGKMNTVLAGGDAPDVFYVGDGDFSRWVKLGVLMNLEPMIKETGMDLSDVWETALTRYRYDGQKSGLGDAYALPMDIAPTVLYYNKKLFDEAGVPYPSSEQPMTWDELLDTAAQLTKDTNGDGKPEQYGIGPLWWEGMVWGNGGEILSADRTEFMLDRPEATEALQFVSDVQNVHNLAPNGRALQAMNDGQMFETGRLAMITSGRYSTLGFRKLNFDWDVAPIPANGKWSGWSASVGFSVSGKTKHPQEAFQFLQYLVSEEVNQIRAEAGLSMPIYKEMANSDVFLRPDLKPQHAEVFLKAAEHQQPGPWTYVPNNKWWDTVNQNLGQLWEGKKKAQQLMEEIKPAVEKALKEGNPDLFR